MNSRAYRLAFDGAVHLTSAAALGVTLGCTLLKPKPSAALATTPSTPIEAARHGTDVSTRKADDANRLAESKTYELASGIKANIVTARTENRNNPEGMPKTIVEGELQLAETKLSDVKADPSELAAAAQRKALVEAGKADEARKAYAGALADSQKLVGELATLRAARDAALLERDAARANETKAIAEFQRQLEENRKTNQRQLDDLIAKHREELEEERKAFFRWMGRALVTVGILCALVGAFTVYSGVQAGNVIAAVTKAGVFIGAAAFFFICAWTINQPWFKWVVIIGGSLSLLAVVGYLWSEHQQSKDKKQRSLEADEAEDTLKRIAEIIHKLPDSDPIFGQLRDAMGPENKALILELRAEAKRQSLGKK